MTLCASFDWAGFLNGVVGYRWRHHLSQTELAAAVGVSDQSLSVILHGRRVPRVDVVAALAFVCDLSLDSYVTETSEQLHASVTEALGGEEP